MKVFHALVVAALLLVTPAHAKPAPVAREALPTSVTPLRYDIHLSPKARDLTFEGHETVELAVNRSTDRIVLNAADIAFKRVSLAGRSEAPCVVLDDAKQTATFIFKTPIAPGRHSLTLDFSGKIYTQASGLFALDYGADKQRALFTQFENSDARRLAPMWDEPGVKSVFSLTVDAPKGQMAVSNMPVASTSPLADGGQAVRFADTPKMSSYLLFLALGDFERVHRQVGATDIGVVVRRGDTARAQFALDAASELLPFYNDYFGVPYPLPKLDFIAGPGRSQFFAAMENWGAIFYFDYALLVDPKTTSEEDRQNVYVDIAHEMAHQWFGDLVTMAWWDDLWLNEGFASWMENKATDHFHPEWKIWLQTKAGEQGAMRIDARTGTHPVITPIADVFAASNAFDQITYQKGHAVIRMLETYVGEAAFRTGVRNYIARHAYGNTVTDDLWTEIDKVSPRKVTAIAHDFTLQAGLPLISAAQTAKGVTLTQSRFGADQASKAPRTWRTPVVVAGLTGPQRPVVSAARPAVLASGPAAAPLLNAGQTGYFRSRYSPELWTRVVSRFPTLAPDDQLGLIYDSAALGQAGYAPMSDFLALASRAQAAGEPIVVQVLAQQLSALDALYDGQVGQPAYRAFARARLAPAFGRLGWDARPGEADNDIVLRTTLITTLGRLDDPAVIAEARRRFTASLAAPGSLTGSTRQAVLRIVASHADAETWEALHRLANAATDITDKTRLYHYLGLSHDPALADKALALALSGEPSATDVPEVISGVAEVYPDKAFTFALAHRAAVDAALEPTSRATFYTRLASGSADPAMPDQLTRFAATIPANARGEVDKAIASVRYRLEIVAKRLPEVDRWLAAHPG